MNSDDVLEELRITTRQALAVGSGDILDELGLAGLLVDPAHGGLGLADREMALVATELGRSLSASAFLPTAVLGATLLSDCQTDEAAELLSAVAEGRHRCAVAITDGASSWSLATSPISAEPAADGGWTLTGSTVGLSTPSEPDVVLVAAATAGGVALFSAAGEHFSLTPADLLDPGRGLAQFDFEAAPATLLAGPDRADAVARAAYRRALVAVAAEQAGLARMSLESSVEYAKSRTQFGSPIGAFQAVKHRCADVLMDIELADAVLADAVRDGSMTNAELAFIVATRAALTASDACIQIHGGIGFTWEHSAHWYFRRARVNSTLMGPPSVHRDAIAGSLGLTVAEESPR